ncbi:fungal hydrophobin-domain-containing protein [Crassisporium funariophilum]|nr:fungal hydrophobin-domain-containing protein [Crassisporium funariophilum]
MPWNMPFLTHLEIFPRTKNKTRKRYKKANNSTTTLSSNSQFLQPSSQTKYQSIKMFARVYSLFFFLFFAFPMLASAAVVARTDQCNTGPIQCCNKVGTAQAIGYTHILAAAGIVIQPVDAILGVECSPITIIGAGGNSCSAQPVCCTGNTYNGLVNVGCTTVNINL